MAANLKLCVCFFGKVNYLMCLQMCKKIDGRCHMISAAWFWAAQCECRIVYRMAGVQPFGCCGVRCRKCITFIYDWKNCGEAKLIMFPFLEDMYSFGLEPWFSLAKRLE